MQFCSPRNRHGSDAGLSEKSEPILEFIRAFRNRYKLGLFHAGHSGMDTN